MCVIIAATVSQKSQPVQTKLSPHNPRPYDINFFSSAWGLALGWLMRHLLHIFVLKCGPCAEGGRADLTSFDLCSLGRDLTPLNSL